MMFFSSLFSLLFRLFTCTDGGGGGGGARMCVCASASDRLERFRLSRTRGDVAAARVRSAGRLCARRRLHASDNTKRAATFVRSTKVTRNSLTVNERNSETKKKNTEKKKKK